jgi:hypothetical protein
MGGISNITNNKKYLKKDLDIWIFLLIFKYKIKVMEKEFIPYEQAIDLKELGFDEPCVKEFHKQMLITNSCGEEMTNSELIYLYGEEDTVIAAPLYQQAFRWFREKYNFDVRIAKDSHNIYHFQIDTNYYSNWILPIFNRIYEEAELECLKKLIEIVKQSQKIYDESPHSKTFRTPASDYNSRGGYRK